MAQKSSENPERANKFNLKDFLNKFGTLLGLLVLVIALSLLSDRFLTVSNLLNVALQSSINAVIAAGMTLVILTAGIDLSVGSVLALSGVVMADVLKHTSNLPLGLFVGLLIGGLAGLANGLMITKAKLPPFIATLAMMSIARGLALVYTSGRPISGFIPSFGFIANGYVLGIPMPVIIVLAVYLLFWFLLNYTKFGRYIYAIGGNEEAAYLSGINVNYYKTWVYVISGITAAIGAIILTSRLNSAQPIAGIMYELDAIAATVIGGTSLMGGEGTIFGTLVGALIIGVLRNGLNLLNVSAYWQQVIIGLVIAFAVFLDRFRRR